MTNDTYVEDVADVKARHERWIQSEKEDIKYNLDELLKKSDKIRRYRDELDRWFDYPSDMILCCFKGIETCMGMIRHSLEIIRLCEVESDSSDEIYRVKAKRRAKLKAEHEEYLVWVSQQDEAKQKLIAEWSEYHPD